MKRLPTLLPSRPLAPLRENLFGLCLCHILFSAMFVGCGSGDQTRAIHVTGKVTYQGQPVEQGEITFEDPAAGQVNSSPLGPGGSYVLELPAGDYRVSVAPRSSKPKARATRLPTKSPTRGKKHSQEIPTARIVRAYGSSRQG